MDPHIRNVRAQGGAIRTAARLLALVALGGLLAGCITGENDTLQDAGPQEDGPGHDPIREEETTVTPVEQDRAATEQDETTDGGGGDTGIY